MNIHVCDGRSSKAGLQNLGLNKLLLFVFCFSLLSEVYTFTVEWSLVSPYQLNQSKNSWYALQGGNSADINFSKGGQIAFMPAPRSYGYGLYNRGSPQVINLNLSKPKHSHESSSEEHKHKRKRHGDSTEEHLKHRPEHHHEHHKSAKEELNEEHAEQAEISAGIADGLTKLSHFMKQQMNKHKELRDRELNRDNEEAAKKEQAIVDLYQDQIKYLNGIEKIQEAIMAGEVEMVYDNDGAGQKHGHYGHHTDGDHNEHGNHDDNREKHHNADQLGHHQPDDREDGDEEHGEHDYDDEEKEEHGSGHHVGDGNDYEGEEHDHEDGKHDHEGGSYQKEDDFHDVSDKFEDNDDPDHDSGTKHHLDKRSPFVSSFLPSLPGSDTSLITPDTTTVDTSVNANTAADSADIKTDTGITLESSDSPSSTPYTTDTPTVVSPDTNADSGWFNWFGSSNTPAYSPFALLKYLSPSDKSADNLMSMFNVFSDPSNSSYLSNASTLMRIVMFFMPGTGIVDQVYFTMALSKIMWEAATMYYEGYGTVEIAVVVLGEMAEASYLSRRGEDSIIDQKILIPGDTIKIEGIDAPAFLKYVKYMKYPDLTETQEAKLQKDIDNLITITYPNISPELKTTFTAGLKDTIKFLALFNVDGDLYVEKVDVNFSDVYVKMHSAFDDSPLEKIKKTILSAIDSIKSKFN